VIEQRLHFVRNASGSIPKLSDTKKINYLIKTGSIYQKIIYIFAKINLNLQLMKKIIIQHDLKKTQNQTEIYCFKELTSNYNCVFFLLFLFCATGNGIFISLHHAIC
jgi:hypothetical protein